MLALVASGLGISIVSSTLAQVRFPGVEFVTLKEAAGLSSFWIASHENAKDATVRLLLSELINDESR
jgi:DNA-binding transcriptional LysR family regulator